MYCPNCGGQCEEGHRFCFRCGTPLPTEEVPRTEEILSTEDALKTEPPVSAVQEPVPQEAGPAAPLPEDIPLPAEETAPAEPSRNSPAAAPRKKGRLWPPLVLMVVMIAVGLAVFFISGRNIGTDPSMPWFRVENGVLYFDSSLYFGGSELTVPDAIGGQTVTALSEGCFADCDRLTTVILPDTLTEIGPSAFAFCENLRGIYLPKTVNTIGTRAFMECPSLEAICIPGSVTSIGADAFSLCTSLRHIFFTGYYQQWIMLYQSPITSTTYVYCSDGAYRHFW